MQVKAMRIENEASNNSGSCIHTIKGTNDLRSLSIATLKSLQSQLRQDLEELEKVKKNNIYIFVKLFNHLNNLVDLNEEKLFKVIC